MFTVAFQNPKHTILISNLKNICHNLRENWYTEKAGGTHFVQLSWTYRSVTM